jgi:polysaccharide biosynthesis/export protein
MTMKMIHCLAAFFLGVIWLVTPALAGDYIIGEGDVLDIAVWGVKELNVSVKVRPDGKITIPGLGDVNGSGVAPSELQKKLSEELKALVKNPIVTVTVKEITNSKVYLFGGGINAGVADLSRRTTLLQLLCTLNNVKNADLKQSYVLRGGKKIKENFYRLFIDGDTAEDVVIESGDSIYLPLLVEKNIYVIGAVNTPKVIEFRDGMTVMEAILEADGFTKFAKQNDTIIMRKEKDADQIIKVKAKDLYNDGDLTQNVRLKANDYVIVKEGMF